MNSLELTTPCSIAPTVICREVITLMQTKDFDQLPVVEEGALVGVVTIGNLLSQVSSGRITTADPVSAAMYRKVRTVSSSSSLADVAEVFDTDYFVVVVDDARIVGLVTRIDLLNYITNGA